MEFLRTTTVPVNEASKVYPEFAGQSLILLVRSQTDAQSALLDIFHNARANWNWLAAGNVLVKTRPAVRSTAALLHRHVHLQRFDHSIQRALGRIALLLHFDDLVA